MPLFPSDLRYMGPDSDGIVRLNRGTTPSDEVPFPSFVGDVRLYRGLAANVGQGDLRGWEIVGELNPNTYLRVATTDAEVGVVSGTNEYQPAGTVDLLHDHGGLAGGGGGGDTFGASGTLQTNDGGSFTTDIPVPGQRSVTDDGTNQVDVSDVDHEHTEGSHHHNLDDHDHGMPTHSDHAIDPDLADDTVLTLEPMEITPQAVSFWLIAYVGVTV